MFDGSNNTLDTVIVGGGVAGLYVAWRLSTASPDSDPSRIAVFEGADRLGGRLWSVGMEQDKAIPAELGGMFFSDAQHLVYGLCTKALALETHSVSPQPDFAYLRRRRFLIKDLDVPGVSPYNLAPDEQAKPYHELLFLALRRIVPDLEQYWPLNPDADFADTLTYLRQVDFQGRRLRHWGFWNLLSKVVSNEAYLCLRDMVGSFAMFNNANGFDAVFATLCELAGNWFKLSRGYESLPRRLGQELEQFGARIRLNSRVTRIEDANAEGQMTVHYESGGRTYTVCARRVVLALPKHAIWNLMQSSGLLHQWGLKSLLDAVKAVPACKLFLTFDDPWWRNVPEGPGHISQGTFAVSHTDLPMRQCYYLGVDPKSGQGLLLASYSDAQSVPFWTALMTESGRNPDLIGVIPMHGLDEIQRQLSEMHGVDVPAPKSGLFVDWTRPPFGGGWHAWKPGWESVNVMKRLRQPDGRCRIHICGEAYSPYQGWVEGALTSAEVLLGEQWGLQPPAWLSSTECLAPYYNRTFHELETRHG